MWKFSNIGSPPCIPEDSSHSSPDRRDLQKKRHWLVETCVIVMVLRFSTWDVGMCLVSLRPRSFGVGKCVSRRDLQLNEALRQLYFARHLSTSKI